MEKRTTRSETLSQIFVVVIFFSIVFVVVAVTAANATNKRKKIEKKTQKKHKDFVILLYLILVNYFNRFPSVRLFSSRSQIIRQVFVFVCGQ